MAVKIPKEVEEAIVQLFSSKEIGVDDDVHALAEKLEIDPHKFEGYIYAMLQRKLSFAECLRLSEAFEQLEEGPYVPWSGASNNVLDTPDIFLPQRLIEAEAELLNRFDDETLSDEAYEQTAGELVELIDEAVATAGQININKGDWVRLRDDEIVKVQNVSGGVVTTKTKAGRVERIKQATLARIGKFQGKPAFGFLTPKMN